MFGKVIKNPKFVLLFILFLTLFSIAVNIPRTPLKINYKGINIDKEIGGYSLYLFNGRFQRDLEIKKGLDIAGGVTVLLKADMTNIAVEERQEAMNSLRDVIERRVNLLGISESNVQTSKFRDEYRVIVELAGIFDATQALEAVGQVAQLEFRTLSSSIIPPDPEGGEEQTPQMMEVFVPSDLTGADLRKASVVFDSTSAVSANEPQIQLQFNSDGIKKFRDITTNNVGKQVAIYLDDQLLLAPTVQTPITDGKAVITGQFTLEEAKTLAAQLNAGALPVPVEVMEQRTIGPTLGQESVEKSIIAGLIGLALVIAFMIAYYGRLGFIASLSLMIYALVTLALYRIIPIVLTLPGLAGFILSIGMAVDSNILIFERIKEERRDKKPLSLAIENGFGRSWDAIRDANTATIMTAFILFNPFNWAILPSSGPVRGFAITLAIGIFISLFTGIFITRNLIRVFYRK